MRLIMIFAFLLLTAVGNHDVKKMQPGHEEYMSGIEKEGTHNIDKGKIKMNKDFKMK